MAQPTEVVDQVAQLDAARNLVLGDAAFYPQIVNGILPIVGAHARLELRRWGADFLAETFATPMLGAAQKEQLAPNVLQAVLETLMLPETDSAVLQSLVQTAASLYPLIFRHMYVHYRPSPIAKLEVDDSGLCTNARCCQCQSSGRRQGVGDDKCDQTGHPPENGLVSMSCQDLLCQVRSTCGASPDTRFDLRPKGMSLRTCRSLRHLEC